MSGDFVKSERFLSTSAVARWVESGRHVFLGDKFLTAAFVRNMTLAAIESQIALQRLFKARMR